MFSAQVDETEETGEHPINLCVPPHHPSTSSELSKAPSYRSESSTSESTSKVTTTSLREALASVAKSTPTSKVPGNVKPEDEIKSKILKIAQNEYKEKLKTHKLKQEVLELKKIKLQLEINNLQGYEIAVVTSNIAEDIQ